MLHSNNVSLASDTCVRDIYVISGIYQWELERE